jgi:hypothetical protein
MMGLHRMAYGNALTIAQFATPDQARQAAKGASRNGGFHQLRNFGPTGAIAYQADQPTDESLDNSLGKITIFTHDRFVIMSSLPDEAMALLQKTWK